MFRDIELYWLRGEHLLHASCICMLDKYILLDVRRISVEVPSWTIDTYPGKRVGYVSNICSCTVGNICSIGIYEMDYSIL